MIEAVLFDLDGTLIDTAPDMGGALNNLLVEENLAPIPMEIIRPLVSQGGLVLTQLGFSGKVAEAGNRAAAPAFPASLPRPRRRRIEAIRWL